MSIIKNMKEAIAKSGSSKKEIIYFGPDSVHRVRFLQELEDGEQFQFHSDFNSSIMALCTDPEEHESCKHCQNGVKMIDNFAWSVWDYDSSSVKILRAKASGSSPIPALIEMYEEFGTILDRDYKIKKVGKGVGSSFVITPMDKEKFSVKKANAYSRKEMEKIFLDAYNSDDKSSSDEDEETDKVSKKPKKKKKSIKDKLYNMDMDDLKEIAISLGMTKKELKAFEDEEELVDELYDAFEEEDIEDVYNEYSEDED